MANSISLRNYGYKCMLPAADRQKTLLSAINANNINVVYDRIATIIGYGNPKKELIEDLEWVKNMIQGSPPVQSNEIKNQTNTISLRDYGYKCMLPAADRQKTLLSAINANNINVVYDRIATIIGYGNQKKELIEDLEWVKNMIQDSPQSDVSNDVPIKTKYFNFNFNITSTTVMNTVLIVLLVGCFLKK